MRRPLFVALFLLVTAISGWSCDSYRAEYDERLRLAQEAVLRDSLYQMRKAIDLYSADYGVLPQSLDDLVKTGYFREIPTDPITEGKDWKVTVGDDPNAKNRKGIADVHSASAAKSSEGTLYSEW